MVELRSRLVAVRTPAAAARIVGTVRVVNRAAGAQLLPAQVPQQRLLRADGLLQGVGQDSEAVGVEGAGVHGAGAVAESTAASLWETPALAFAALALPPP